jgi:hypothetical protein
MKRLQAQPESTDRRLTEENAMRRTHRPLAALTLGLALVAATTTIPAAAQPPGTRDQADQRKALYQSELERNLQLRSQAEDKVSAEDRLLAARKALYQSELEHNLAAAPARAVGAATQPRQAAPSPDLNVLATLLLGLVGGLVGGAAAMVGWTTMTRRRRPRVASAR